MNTTFTTYAEKKAKQFFNLLQGYTKGIRMTAILILLLMGVNNAWGADFQGQGDKAGWISGDSDEGLILTWNKNSSTATTKMKYKSLSSGGDLGSITTGLKLTKIEAKIWRIYKYGNICSATIFWELRKGDTFISSGSEDCTKWGDWSNNNCTLSQTLDIDFLSKTTGPGIYTIRVYGKLTGRSQEYEYGDPSYLGCSDNFWYNNNNNGYYSITFTIDPVVTFKANGGTGSDYTQTVTYNTNTTLAANKFTRTNYTFAGWTTKADGSGTSYTDKQTVKLTANTTLYAKWTKNVTTYTVNYGIHSSGGGNLTATANGAAITSGRDVEENQTIVFTATPEQGYQVEGWYSDANCTAELGNGYSITNENKICKIQNLTKIETVFVKFKENTFDVTVTVNDAKGGTTEPSGLQSQIGQVTGMNIAANVNSGYQFIGWDFERGAGAFGAANAASTTFKPSQESTIRANFKANTYTITWDVNDGSGTKTTSEYTYDGAIVELPTPTREGYTFDGWFTAASDGTKITEIGTNNKPTSNVTYYAHWSEILSTITIIANNPEYGTLLVDDLPFTSGNTVEVGITTTKTIKAVPNPGYGLNPWIFAGDAKWLGGNNPVQLASHGNGTTGTLTANFVKLETKTIYLKTVEGTTDGVKWYVKYNDTEYLMDELGCTNEYYKGVVPEGTSFQFISKDNGGETVETKGTDLQYVEGKTLYNLVSAAASGDKIFFKPNSYWKNHSTHKYFVARFWAGSAVIKDLIDNDGDGIYECEKPAGATNVYFFLTKEKASDNSWNDWPSDKAAQTHDNVKEGFKDGKNLFTLGDDQTVGGENDTGTWSEFADTPVNGEGEWTTFTGITYRITFDQQEATTAGTTHVDVAYHASMPEIEKLPTKTEKKFGGYYTQANGQGVMLVNAFGEWQNETGYISSTTWEREECVTLYAYWKELTPEITDVTLNAEIFEPVDENQERFVTAEPTIDEHNNTTLTYVVCWKLLYTNGREVEGDQYQAEIVEGNKVQFSIAGLSTGTYTIRASLRTGGDCNSGEEISRFDKQFSIVANRIVTVNYTCDGREIMASTKQNAHVINATSITAPDIVGYTFKAWVAGDGVIISTANKASKTIEFTAYYDGYLTATYTKKKMVYFYNTMGWDNVYVYFYSSDKYWDNNMGSGSDQNQEIDGTKAHWFKYRGKMTQIQGTDIWYFDYLSLGGEIDGYTNIVFNKYQQDDYEWFNNTEAVRRADFNAEKLPMYVPIKADEETKNGTKYYNKGYWMNYPENTGYKLQIYDKVGDGAKEVASVRFPYSTNTIMPLTVSVDLEAGKTYGFKILREDNTYFGNNGTITKNITNWSFETDKNNCELQTTLAGDYTFTLKYADSDNNKDYKYRVDVVYPVSVGDYRVIYKDKAQWSQTAAHGDNWYHPSYAIKKNSSNTEEKTDIVSFFIAKDNNPVMKFQKCTAINEQTVTWTDVANGTITIPDDVVTAAGVYNFIVKQPTNGGSIAVESVEPYTGNYYIRVDAMDGKWGNYKTNPANRMTYSDFSESEANKFGDKFSHYATKWCEEGTNVKFTIANDYSPCISDTLIQDNGNPFNNIDIHGNLTSNDGKNAANIRFMWNRHTNKISRAYVAGSTFTDRQFLILKADKEIKNASGGNLSNDGDNHNAHQAIFSDTQNWIYERTIQVQPGTRVKLYACYPTTDVANAQYFRGKYDNNNATWNDDNSVQILGGTDESWNTIRIIYDFKTNRLMAAWIPTGEINGAKSLEADMMILREHQEDAACITFANSAEDKLINVQTVYGVLRFNRWVLNNRKATGGHEALDVKDQKTIYERALYFISFPFNVHLSDVFGFGTYGTHWVISEYNGKRRAERGYFADNCVNEDCTNWDYIWDPSNVTLEANKGYLLSLDLDLMKHDNTSFWAHDINTVELCFPSYEHVQTIQQTNYTMSALGTEYECKINHNTPDGDRRVKDSYWRCIGVPSFADYNNALTTDGTNTITWKPKGNEFPFLYEWNVSDNSLMVCAASQYKFRPTFAYLVQNGNEIHWSAVNATPTPTSIAARQRTDVERNYEWKITLSRDDNQEDQTFLRMTDNEEVTAEFDFGQDLSKELNYGRSDIYTLIGYERAAANSMPLSDSTTVVPLGLDIDQAGDYTIAMPEGVESVGVTLLDAETGERTNLSMGMDYTISLNKGVWHNRLYLEISPIQQTPTDIEYTDQGTREQSVRKVLIDGKLYIVCDGVVYDAQGKRM